MVSFWPVSDCPPMVGSRPIADGHVSRKQTLVWLPDHLVGAYQERLRDGETQRLSGFAVDEQFECRRWLDRQVTRLGALEDLVHIRCSAPVAVGLILPVAYQPPSLYVFPNPAY